MTPADLLVRVVVREGQARHGVVLEADGVEAAGHLDQRVDEGLLAARPRQIGIVYL
jgi:hypothetical protein